MAEHAPTIALALAGGNALGAYAAGAYEALHERGYLPELVSGASIGAVTGGIIAGNPPAGRVGRLRELWQQASAGSALAPVPTRRAAREWYNGLHALQALVVGRPGLFFPRAPGAWSMLPGIPPDVALLDNRSLMATLQRLVDFEHLNRAEVPLMISAVDMESGEPIVFDTRRQTVSPAHILASTAFAPVFPPVEIDGRWIGDPGLFANLPLDALLDPPQAPDLLCFAVDLFDARGARPRSLGTSAERAQDILFGSQSLRTLEARAREHRLRCIIRQLAGHVSRDARSTGRAADLLAEGRDRQATVVLVAYRAPPHELASKTLEFSRASVRERWAAGTQDMHAAIDRLENGEPTSDAHDFRIYDCRRGTP